MKHQLVKPFERLFIYFLNFKYLFVFLLFQCIKQIIVGQPICKLEKCYINDNGCDDRVSGGGGHCSGSSMV